MSRTRVKICGVRDADTARAAADAGADAIGLVFVPASPRAVDLRQAEAILRVLPAFVEPVALFVNAAAEEVRRACAALGVRTVQLHGQEGPDYAAGLAPLRVLRSMTLEGDAAGRLAAWSRPEAGLAGVVWDAAPPAGAAIPGGTGTTLDWDALARLLRGQGAGGPPAILAGGLTPGNVAQAIATVRPYAVDVSSGVESQRGLKSVALIQAFCHAARGDKSHF